MAFIRADIKIPEMERTINTSLYFPTDLPAAVGNEVKGVITLLHGLSNMGSDWMMMSAACRYAADNGYILVAPSVDNSFYHNMVYGTPFYTLMTEHLPAALDKIFKIPRRREVNFIAGLSMGGYGALRIGLSKPERYAAIGSFSGGLSIETMKKFAEADEYTRTLMQPVLGEDITITEEVPLANWAKKVAELPAAEQPRLFLTHGRQDPLGVHTKIFLGEIAGLPLDVTHREWDGVHEWNFWDRSLAEFIGFIQNSDYGQRKKNDWAAPADETKL